MPSGPERTLSNEELERIVRGERAAVTAFASAFLPRVYGLALRISRRRDVAEEATQETFVRALKALPKLRQPERLVPWLLTIAANTVREVSRKKPRESPLDHDPPEVERGRGDLSLARQSAVERAVAALAPVERELFLLHTVEGLGLEDLAQEHDTTASAMKARLHRIRARVRAEALHELEAAGVMP